MSHFPEFSGQFLQPPDSSYIKAKPSLDTSLWILKGKIKLRTGLVGDNKLVVENWVLDGIYKMYNIVRSLAYKYRCENKLKTQI